MNTTCLLTQVRLNYFNCDCGMSYVIRCDDGRFVIIDGGIGEYDEPLCLLEKLRGQNTLEKITVAAWIITHPHVDHFGTFIRFIDAYGDQIVLESLVYRWPPEGKDRGRSNTAEFDRVVGKLAGTPIITPETGDRMTFGNCRFDFIFTEADLPDGGVYSINDCSLAFFFTYGNYRTLFIGDGLHAMADVLCERYTPEELRCDILQVGHHGYSGGSSALYTAADARIVLWPCPDYHIPYIAPIKANTVIRGLPRLERIYYGGQEEITLDLSEDLRPEARKIEPELRWNRFDRVCGLHWQNNQGGSTGFGPVSVVMNGDSCLIKSPKEAFSAIELIQPWQVEGRNFRFEIKGTLHSGVIGFQFSGKAPHGFAEANPVWPAIEPGEPFCLSFTSGTSYGCGKMSLGGEEVAVAWNPYADCGVHMFLKEGEIEIKDVSLVLL